MARIAPHGRVRRVERGDVLVDTGDQTVPFFVVLAGQLEIVRGSAVAEEIVVVHQARPVHGRDEHALRPPGPGPDRVREAGEVIEVDHAKVMALVQTDSELSEILMRAFILRRVELIKRGSGDVVLVGSRHSGGTLRVKEFLTRNGHPYSYIDLDEDSEAQDFLDGFRVRVEDVPVLICRGKAVLRNPTNQEIAECLGLNAPLDRTQVRDVVIVGAGPAGLAAAVYGSSEGLDVLILESTAPGGQAGSSSWIENYLGFPTGITGQDLAGRAYTQAQKFGAQMIIASSAKALSCQRRPYAIQIDNGQAVPARTVIVATGAAYRKLSVDDLTRFEGAGVYYGATATEAQLCRNEEVIVVGGGNSAGQAAVFLAQASKRVHMFVRAEGLAETMSRYLIRRIERTPGHRAADAHGSRGPRGQRPSPARALRATTVRARSRPCDVGHVFVMTGAEPTTKWLADCVVLDAKGFIKTGPDLSRDELTAAGWPLARAPHLLETSLPGVFAVGDVRSGNLKRVASAVGEGSTAVALVHQVLKE